MTIKVYNSLTALNELSHKKAETAFLDCCGSTEWARVMTSARPFAMLDQLFETAAEKWFGLPPADWLEAFAAHPKIGSTKPAPSQKVRAARWSAGEQNGMAETGDDVSKQMAEINGLYQAKFGFIFIISATGKSADEMLAKARARLGNSMATELEIAAHEQHKITELRLAKLLEK